MAKPATLTPGNWTSRIVGHADVAPANLVPHPLNWREHPPHQRAAVMGSIAEVGWVRSVLVNKRTGRLLDGHLRLVLALERSEASVPVEYVDVSEDEERIILATLDPMAALAGANAERFAELTEALNVRSDALRDLIEQLQRPVMKAGNTDPDALPDNVPARAKLGDVWALGEHRLGCGDATKGEDVVRVLPTREQWPMLMVTDPPYGVEYDPAWRDEAAAKGQIAYAASRVGEVANDERVDWTPAWELFPGDVAYVWHAGRHASEVQASMQRTGFEIRNQVIWAKAHSPITRGHYRWRHEPCWYAVRKGATAHWIGDRTQSTLWEIALDPNVAGGHSTQKPVECMARPLRNHKGDVYDPFLGSGTTLIAAEQLGRRCYAIEIEPKYVDVAIARWEAFTGKKAEKCQ